MVGDRSTTTGISADSAAVTDSWPQMKNHRWARTSLRRAVASPITVSMWDAVRSFTIAQWSGISAGGRWKRFLSQLSRGNAQSGFDASRHPASMAPR